MLTLAGVLVMALGVLALFKPVAFSVKVLLTLTAFGAVAAVSLPSGSTILPAHFFLFFVILRVLFGADRAWAQGHVPAQAGIWLSIAIGYGLLVTAFMPTMFPGLTNVFLVGLYKYSVPLMLAPGHITQGIYAIGGLLTYFCVIALLRRTDAVATTLSATAIASTVIVFFAALDLVSYYAGFPQVMKPLHTAAYKMLNTLEFAGLKRVVGSYPEASVFVINSSMFYAFSFHMWLSNVRRLVFGPLTAAFLIFLLISTSGTAYVFVVVHLGMVGIFLMHDLLVARQGQRSSLVAVTGYFAILAGLVILLEFSSVLHAVQDFLDHALFSKSTSDSGIERSMIASQAMRNLFETGFVGVGIGGSRGSGFLTVLLANIGVFGTFCYLAFVASVAFAGQAGAAMPPQRKIVSEGAKFAMLSGMVAAGISLTIFEIGVGFYLFAAAAVVLSYPAASPVRRGAATLSARIKARSLGERGVSSPPSS